MTAKMFAPAGRGGIITSSKTGTVYTIAADGSILAADADVGDLIGAGFASADRDGQAATGIGTVRIPLKAFTNSDGSVLAAAPAAGKFGLTLTFGTSQTLLSETANSNTKTDIATLEYQLPNSYVAGQDLTLSVNAIVSGTLTTKTIAADARKMTDAGAAGANLIATAAQVMGLANADSVFTITGATLSPGDRIMLQLTMVITEASAANQTGKINSVRLT